MSDISQVITQILNHPALAFVVIFLALVLILHVNRARFVKNWLNFKTQYLLNRLGVEQLSNIQCSDELGNHFTIDRLILRPDGISLLVVKKYPGKIFCSDHIDHWSQMLGQKSYRFTNPLFELDYQVKAMSKHFSTDRIDGYLFFDHHATFPRGHPRRVIHPQNIPETLNASVEGAVAPDTLLAWEKIKTMTDTA
jgi:hypothetical protein